MKRFSKILVALLALCLLVGALALAISANNSAPSGKYVVLGKGYDTWEEAVLAANNTATIYLNEDEISFDSTVEIAGADTKVKLNLNGKTLTAASDVTLFTVTDGASLTIEGTGTVNVGLASVATASGSTVSVDGTGAGIVINHTVEAGDASTVITSFASNGKGAMNVSGKITVNAKSGKRVVFDVQGASALNVANANISVPHVNGEVGGGHTYVIEISDNVVINVSDSKFDIECGMAIFANCTTSKRDVTNYYDKDTFAWSADAAKSIKLDAATVDLNVTNSTFRSGCNCSEASLMRVSGAKMDAHFDKCVFYTSNNPSTGSVAIGGLSSRGTQVAQNQLYFTDCDFMAEGTARNWFFYDGANYKIIGGSFNNEAFARGSFNYLPLTDEEGNPTGQWIGGYIDNILLPTAKTFATTGGYADLTATAANSRVKGTVTRVIDGNEYTFASGYFSDSDSYYSYVYGVDDNIKVNQNGNANGNAVSYIALNVGTKTTVAAADDPAGKGNGYVKTTITENVGSAHVYSRISTPQTQIADTELIIAEFDVMSDSRYPTFYIPLRVRNTKPKFDANGKHIGSEGNNDTASSTFQIYYYSASQDRMKFNTKTLYGANPNQWYRITFVFDIVKTATTVEVNPWVNGAKDTTQTVTMDAIDVSQSKLHVYVDGSYFDSVSFGANFGVIEAGKSAASGKIIAYDKTGAATNSSYTYDFNSYFYKGKSANTSIAFDNYRYSAYSDAYVSPEAADYDFGLYQADGTTPVTSIKNNEHFLVMPDNKTTDFTAPAPVEPTYVAKVDGVGYETEEAAVAAIQSGSTLELLQNFNNNIEKNCAYTVVTNGFTVPGFISEDYKVVDYTGANGTIVLTEAAENEKFGIKYSFGTKDVTEYAALGTLFTATEESFPGANGPDYTIQTVTSWNAPTGVASGLNFALVTNAIPAETGSVDAYYETGSIYYVNLEDAMAAANGETVKLLRNLNVSALDGVVGTTGAGTGTNAATKDAPVGFNLTSDLKLDLNGKTIEQGFDGVLFNVTDAKLELIGEATVNGAGTLVSVSGANAMLTVKAYGNGLTFNSSNGYSSFVITGGASSYVFGNVSANLAASNTVFWTVGAKNVEFERANVVASHSAGARSSFIVFGANNITINKSHLETDGSMFVLGYKGVSGTAVGSYLYNDGTSQYYYADPAKLVNGKVPVSILAPDTVITATDSELFAQLAGSTGQTEAQFFQASGAKVKADFTRCDIIAGNRTMSLGGTPYNANPSKIYIAPNQFTFTDCNYKSMGKNSASVFTYNVNVYWKGGTISWEGGSLTSHTFVPFECNNGFVGAWFEDVHTTGTATSPAATTAPTSQYQLGYFKIVSQTTDTTFANKIINGELVGFTRAWLNTDVENPIVHVRYASAWNSQDADFAGISLNSVTLNYTESGKNGYLKLSVEGEADFGKADKYFDFRLGDAPSKDLAESYPDGFVPTALRINIANSRFMVQEFDISTDNMLPEGLVLGMQPRQHYASAYGVDADGNVIITEAKFGYAGVRAGRIVINPDGSCEVFNADASIDVTPGVWNRFTIVYEFVKTETTMERTTADGTPVSVPAYDFWGSKAHAYINGEYVTSFNLFTDDDSASSSRYVEKTTAETYSIFALRAGNIENAEDAISSVCVDNVVAAAYNVDPGIYNGDTLKTTITKTDKIYTQPFTGHGVIVDGHAYRTLEETVAAIKDGSIVELTNNFATPIAVNAKDITLITNGYSFAGFVSEDKKVIDYSASGYLYTETAAADEIFEITYDYDEKQASQIAALGTVLSAPAIFDSYKTPVRVDSEWSFLSGWTLVDGEEGYVVTADGVAYPVIETVASVIINWLDENGEVLDTDYYFPGASKVLDEYDGPAIADTATEKYYSVGFIGWDGIEAATEALATPGAEFEIMAVMGYKAPETFGDEGDLKINLSLYSNYVMNFYIPTNLPISDVVISTTADGSKALVNRGNVTLDGSGEHVRFSYLFNTADAELMTFYIVYTVDEHKIAFPVEYSVPAYAFAVMEQADAIESDANKAELAKKLVVNMANYANEYIKACGNEANDYYAYIVDTYGTEYLTEYRGLTNDKFTAEGYTASAGVDGLLEDISFYFGATPAFVIKVADGYTVNVKYGNSAYVAATLGEDGYFYSYAGRDDAEQRSLSLSKMTDTITFEITNGDGQVGTVEYSLEAYINNLIESSQENFINAAKALYAFANAAAAYKAA